jgi:hypothetical protein
MTTSPARFPPDVLDLFVRSEEVEIETNRRMQGGAPPRRTVIWIVVQGGDVFVRSVRGERGRWYRDLLADPNGALHVDGRRIRFRAIRADDASSTQRCSQGLEEEYARDPSLGAMLRPEVLPTTLRLEPAAETAA